MLVYILGVVIDVGRLFVSERCVMLELRLEVDLGCRQLL
jgi:hypothetical protein